MTKPPTDLITMLDPSRLSDAGDTDVEQLPMPFFNPSERPARRRLQHPPDPQPTETPVYLPSWPKRGRGVPNAILRGALFPAIHAKNRRFVEDELIRTQSGIEISFTGYQFDQADLNTWETCLDLARHHPLGNVCEFTAHGFLTAIGRKRQPTDTQTHARWSYGKRDFDWLRQSLGRLTSGLVSITHNDLEYFGTLIHGGVRHRKTGQYRILLNPALANLYVSGYWSSIDWKQRYQLRKKPLALWLHGYYTSHRSPYPLKVRTLHELSGSRTRRLANFNQNLKNALDALKDVGALTHYTIENNLVHVTKPDDTP